MEQLQDTPKLECLMVRDGEPDLVPLKLIQQAPLKHLRLDPRIRARVKEYHIRPEVLGTSTLELLSLGLARDWYTQKLNKALQSKCLPALNTLWLSLATIQPGWGVFTPSCTSLDTHSWMCSTRYPEKRSPVVFLEGLDNPELSLLNIKFPHGVSGSMFLDVIKAANSNCRLRNLTDLTLATGNAVNDWRGSRYRQKPEVQPTEL
jgi:hypothetical protein